MPLCAFSLCDTVCHCALSDLVTSYGLLAVEVWKDLGGMSQFLDPKAFQHLTCAFRAAKSESRTMYVYAKAHIFDNGQQIMMDSDGSGPLHQLVEQATSGSFVRNTNVDVIESSDSVASRVRSRTIISDQTSRVIDKAKLTVEEMNAERQDELNAFRKGNLIALLSYCIDINCHVCEYLQTLLLLP